MSKHTEKISPITQLKERLAKMSASNAHLCYGKRCAAHHNNWYAWTTGRAL